MCKGEIIPELNRHNHFIKLSFIATILFFCINFSFAQTFPLTVTATQAINFGTICQMGSGGTVTVGYDGSISSTGDIVLISKAPFAQPAIYEITLCPGGTVNVSFDATTTLTGSNGVKLTLDIGPTEKGPNGCSFMTNSDCNIKTILRVGGTLHLPGTLLSGLFTGGFAITVNQQ